MAHTAQKMKFSIKDFFSKCDQIRSFLRIWSQLLKKSLMENFIFCAMTQKSRKVIIIAQQQPYLHDANINQLDLTLLLHSYTVNVFSIEYFSTSKLWEVPCKRDEYQVKVRTNRFWSTSNH